uniref:Putative DNA binding, helix-turn-helix domain containing protein n=1 Tax=viral metagenome TaxID=1070528 RepID=A0A6H2A0M4_9ZZZZ
MAYKIRDKKKRNQEVIAFKANNPDLTQEEIAAVFGIDRSRISRILKNSKNDVSPSQTR